MPISNYIWAPFSELPSSSNTLVISEHFYWLFQAGFWAIFRVNGLDFISYADPNPENAFFFLKWKKNMKNKFGCIFFNVQITFFWANEYYDILVWSYCWRIRFHIFRMLLLIRIQGPKKCESVSGSATLDCIATVHVFVWGSGISRLGSSRLLPENQASIQNRGCGFFIYLIPNPYFLICENRNHF